MDKRPGKGKIEVIPSPPTGDKNNFNPKVSIVIPVYNGSNYLQEAIESALGQTYRNIEVLVINDGSTDGGKTERIARTYGERIEYYYKENGGVGSALNLGIKKMTGRYFSWLSHDDVYYPWKVESQIAYLSRLENKDDILYGDYDIIDKNSRVTGQIHSREIDPERFLYEVLFRSFLNGCTVLVPRICFEKIGVFNEALKTTQDYDLWVRLAKHFNFIHMPEVLIQSRQHADQGSLSFGHIEDIDSFYVWCLHEVAPDNIKKLYGIDASRFYRNAASSYRSRGLKNAYTHAMALAVDHARMEHNYSILRLKPEKLPLRKRIFHGCNSVRLNVRKVYYHLKAPQPVSTKFREVYQKNIWNSKESRSGAGSTHEQTAIIRIEIPRLLQELNVKSMLDAPCGDFNWMKVVSPGVDLYLGVDIVEELIKRNRALYADGKRQFLCLDLIRDKLPRTDIILCRDCLVHLTFREALDTLRNFKKSGATYLLITTFSTRKVNEENSNKDTAILWRPLNFQLPPFNFPEPIKLINEGCIESDNQYKDKCLGLWRLRDLRLGDVESNGREINKKSESSIGLFRREGIP